MSRFGRFKTGRGGGSYRPRLVAPDPWADSLLASDPSLPRDAPFRRGMICALMERQCPGKHGHWNDYDSDSDRELWKRGCMHAEKIIAQRGI